MLSSTPGGVPSRSAALSRKPALVLGLMCLVVGPPGTAGAAGGWEVYLSGSSLGSFDEALAVAVNSAGDVVASGYTDELSGMALDVAKLSGADGTVRWQYRLPGEESKPQAVAVDPSGDVIAVGSIDGPGSRDFVGSQVPAGRNCGGRSSMVPRRTQTATGASVLQWLWIKAATLCPPVRPITLRLMRTSRW